MKDMDHLPILCLREVSKGFDAVQALARLNLDIHPGEIHAVVGENGAGKSTMVKLIAGLLRPDSGEIYLLNSSTHGKTPKERLAMGLGVVYQDPAIFPDLSILENVFMGHFPIRRCRWNIPWLHLEKYLEEILENLGVSLDSRSSAKHLGSEGLCIIGVARALIHAPKVLLMDEPTASLDRSEGERLFHVLRRLSTQGVGILYISHRLEEVFDLAHRVTVLRDGHLISTRMTSQTHPDQVIREMVGRMIHGRVQVKSLVEEDICLKTHNLTTHTGLKGISFAIHRGEILGLAGLVGSGRTRLMRALFGLDRQVDGNMELGGISVHIGSPSQAISLGIALVPEERSTEGLAYHHSIWMNIVSPILARITRFFMIRKSLAMALAEELCLRLGIKGPGLKAEVSQFSGGNQQKVVLAKWLATSPKLLLLDDPTKGVDVGAKAEIHAIMEDLCESGLSIIMASSELSELLHVCHRIGVLRDGMLVDILRATMATQEDILALACGTQI